jgi:hypothetical protein
MGKSIVTAAIDKKQNVNVNMHWKDDKEMFFLMTSFFSTLIKIIGKEKILLMVEEGDKLKIKEVN